MTLGRLVRHAWRALLLHKLRSLLSTLGIVFAVVAVVDMLAIGEGARREALEQLELLGTRSVVVRRANPRSSSAPDGAAPGGSLMASDAAALKRLVPGVRRVAVVAEVPVLPNLPRGQASVEVLAVSSGYQALRGLTVRDGRPLCQADEEQHAPVCVLGDEAARLLGADGRLHGLVRLGDRSFRVVGRLPPRRFARPRSSQISVRDHNLVILVPLGTQPGERPSDRRGDLGVSEVAIQLGAGADIRSAAAVAQRVLLRRHGGAEDFQLVIPEELLEQAQRTQRLFNMVLGAIAAISLLVGGIGIMNVMLSSVSERTREIGIRRAVGATQAQVAAHFLCESTLLTGIGGILGVGLGALGAVSIGAATGWPTVMTPWSVALSLGMTAGVGLLSGLYPAVVAARLEPVEALRHE